MSLTRNERWILSNQYRILAALCPDEAEHFDAAREAIDCGYELHYSWLTEHIYEDIMSVEECREVIDILSMFEKIKWAYDALADKSGIDEWRTKFGGFSGNEEGKQTAYARYYCTHDTPRFVTLGLTDKDFNGHIPVLGRYRRMLGLWEASQDKNALTKEDIVRITSV